MYKRVISLLLILSMTTATLMGCGNSKDSENENSSTYSEQNTTNTEDEVVTLNLCNQLSSYKGSQTGWYADILKKKLGIEVNIYETDEDVEPDIYLFEGETAYKEAIDDGLCLDWNSDGLLENYGSYIADNLQTALNYSASNYGNGKVYGIGTQIAQNELDHSDIFYTWDIRWDIYKQLEYPEINDLDDLFTVLSNMQNLARQSGTNDIYAISGCNDYLGLFMSTSIAAYYGYESFGVDLYDHTSGETYDYLSTDGPYIEMIRFYNKLYRAGLLDPEAADNSLDELQSKVEAGKVLFSFTNYNGSIVYNTEENLSEDKIMCPLVANEAHPLVSGLSSYGLNYIVAINSNTKYPEKCIELINYLCTPEGIMEQKYGPEELCWYYDDNGLSCFTSLGKNIYYGLTTRIVSDDSEFEKYNGQEFDDGNCELGINMVELNSVNPITGEKYNAEHWKSNQTESTCKTEQDWKDYTRAGSTFEYMENTYYTVSPDVDYTERDKSLEFTQTWNTVQQDIEDGTWNAIFAETDEAFESAIDNMIEKANADGYAECKDWSDEEISRYTYAYNELFE